MEKDTAQAYKKDRDVSGIVNYLTNMFNNITSHMDRPYRNPKTGEKNKLYIYQTEFAYRLNEIMQSVPSTIQKGIAECNELIDHLMQEADQTKNKSKN